MKKWILIAIVEVLILTAFFKWSSPKPIAYEDYTVRQGDTIYSISSALTDDWRDASDIIREVNNLQDCIIHEGQEITIPIY